MAFYVGTSGFSYKSWKGNFYPEKIKDSELLDFYVKRFNTVEINASFYITPKQKTVENWKQKAPDDFIFTFKLSRYITHYTKLNVEDVSYDKFFTPLEIFTHSSAPHVILVQLPKNQGKDLPKIRKFVKKLPVEFRYAYEFRHPSWFDEDVYDFLSEIQAALVLADSPEFPKGKMWPLANIDTTGFFYIRFHGSSKLYTSRYTDAELDEFTEIIREKMSSNKDVYAYFNNDAHGHAPHDAIRLREKVLGK